MNKSVYKLPDERQLERGKADTRFLIDKGMKIGLALEVVYKIVYNSKSLRIWA